MQSQTSDLLKAESQKLKANCEISDLTSHTSDN